MQHTTTRLAGVIVTGGLVMAALAAPSAALASQPIPTHTVTICHATDSDTNPYVEITVDVASTGELEHGHSGHAGPVWNPTLKAAHVKWGDIIPAYTYGDVSFPGQNLGDGGQAILDAGCEIPGEEIADEQPADEEETDTVEEEILEEQTSEETESPADEEETESPADEEPTSEGEIVYDGPFETSNPDSTPVGAVLGATGRPDMTPPATDTIGEGAATTSGSGLPAILLVLAGLSTMALVLGRRPVVGR